MLKFFMVNLDDPQVYSQIDQEGTLDSIKTFPSQIEKCHVEWQKITLPDNFSDINSVLILGMGGSSIGGLLLKSLVSQFSSVPVEVLQDYIIPAWVNPNTLVIADSYSGNTEETLFAFSQAAKITKKLAAISSGGQLETFAKNNSIFHYKINYKTQPRAAFGFAFMALLELFQKLNLVNISEENIIETISLLGKTIQENDINIADNQAKNLAKKLYGKIPIIIGSGNVFQVAHRWKTQINENSKTVCFYEPIPEMNHNAIVGLEFPDNLQEKIFVVILKSKFNFLRNQLREKIIAEIFERKNISYEVVSMNSTSNALTDILQLILFGDFVSYYLAILNSTAPESIDNINYLKQELAAIPFEQQLIY